LEFDFFVRDRRHFRLEFGRLLSQRRVSTTLYGTGDGILGSGRPAIRDKSRRADRNLALGFDRLAPIVQIADEQV
jgi:hypothetical protein